MARAYVCDSIIKYIPILLPTTIPFYNEVHYISNNGIKSEDAFLFLCTCILRVTRWRHLLFLIEILVAINMTNIFENFLLKYAFFTNFNYFLNLVKTQLDENRNDSLEVISSHNCFFLNESLKCFQCQTYKYLTQMQV